MEDDDTVCPEPPQHSGQEQQADDGEADGILAPLLAPVDKDPTKSSRPPWSHLGADSLLSHKLPVVTAKKASCQAPPSSISPY